METDVQKFVTKDMIPEIEKALDLKLYDNQKGYLLGTGYLGLQSSSGRTTAVCIETALSKGKPLNVKCPEEFSDYWTTTLDNRLAYSRGHFIHEFMDIYFKLKNHGFEVRELNFEDSPQGHRYY